MQNAFNCDMSSLNAGFTGIDLSNAVDLSSLNFNVPEMNLDLASMLSQLKFDIDSGQLFDLASAVVRDYGEYSSKDAKTDWAKLPEAFGRYVSGEEGRNLLRDEINKIINESGIDSIDPSLFADALSQAMAGYPQWLVDHEITTDDPNAYTEHLADYLNSPEGQARINEALGTMRNAFADVKVTEEQLGSFAKALSDGYTAFAQEEGDLPDPSLFTENLNEFLAKDSTRTGRLAWYGSIEDARTFFKRQSMEEIVRLVNRKEEGGDGLADEFVLRYAEVQNG
jgi:hypothetical protein